MGKGSCHRNEQNGSHRRRGQAADKAIKMNSQQSEDPTAQYSPDKAQEYVSEDSKTATTRNLAAQPAGYQSDKYPPEYRRVDDDHCRSRIHGTSKSHPIRRVQHAKIKSSLHARRHQQISCHAVGVDLSDHQTVGMTGIVGKELERFLHAQVVEP